MIGKYFRGVAPRVLLGSAFAAAVALAAAAPAHASGRNSASVSVGAAGGFSDRTRAPQLRQKSNSNFAIDGSAATAISNEGNLPGASFGTIAGASAGAGRLGVSVSNSAVAAIDNTQVNTFTQALAITTDMVTLKDFNHTVTSGKVIWVGSLDLSGSLSATANASGDGGRAFSGANGDVRVGGTGVQACPFASRCGTTSRQAADTESGHVTGSHDDPTVASIQWIMPLFVDVETQIFLRLSVEGNAGAAADFSNNRAAGSSTFNADFGHTLKWATGGYFMDPDTGEILHGLSLISDSGFDYLNPHFDGESGTVPEPASWAFMIAGFGLTGASLRARRRGEREAVAA